MRKRPRNDHTAVLVMCAAMVLLVVAATFISGDANPNNIIAREQIAPTTQTAGFFSSLFSSISHIFTSFVSSVNSALHTFTCSAFDAAWFGSCSGSSGASQSSSPAPPAPPPAACGTNTTSSSACGFSVAPQGGTPGSSAQILAGGAATLAWSCPSGGGYTSASGSGGTFSTGGALSGETSVTPSTTTTYQLSCRAAGGASAGSVTVEVVPLQLSISVDPDRVRSGSPAALSWSAVNLSSGMQCAIVSAPSGIFAGSWSGTGTSWSGSSVNTGPIEQRTVFTLSCVLGSGTVSQSATVNLVPVEKEI